MPHTCNGVDTQHKHYINYYHDRTVALLSIDVVKRLQVPGFGIVQLTSRCCRRYKGPNSPLPSQKHRESIAAVVDKNGRKQQEPRDVVILALMTLYITACSDMPS